MSRRRTPGGLGEAAVAGVARAGAGQEVLVAEADHHRQLVALGEGAQARPPGGAPAAAAGQHQRRAGALEEAGDLGQILGRGGGLRDAHGGAGHGVGRGGQHVLGQRHHHRPRAAGLSNREGAGHQLGHPVGVVDLHRPLGERAEDGAVVDLLEGLAVAHGGSDLPDEEDHRRAVLPRGVHADGGVGGAGAAGHEADAGLARQLAPGGGHEGGAALLAVGDQPDAVGHVVERVEHREIALARHAEGRRRALREQAVHQEPGPVRAHANPLPAQDEHISRPEGRVGRGWRRLGAGRGVRQGFAKNSRARPPNSCYACTWRIY